MGKNKGTAVNVYDIKGSIVKSMYVEDVLIGSLYIETFNKTLNKYKIYFDNNLEVIFKIQ